MRPSFRSCSLVGLALIALAGCGSDPEKAKPASDASTSPDGAATAIAKTQITTANGMVFDARTAGPENGPLVLLLHGFPETSYEWRHELPALAKAGYRAVAPSQRGYSPGARPPNIADYGVVLLAQDVLAMADALGAQKFHVVGHDWGAAVAWVVSVIAKDRVISVEPMSVPHPDAFAKVLAMKGSDAGDGGDSGASCQYNASSYFDLFTKPSTTDLFLANDFAFLRTLYSSLPQADVDVYLQELGNRETIDAGLNWYRANVANRQLNNPGLGPTTVPTMFLWSDQDSALCRDGADLTAQYVTGPYEFDVLTGINHWIPEMAPDKVNELLLAHLAKYP